MGPEAIRLAVPLVAAYVQPCMGMAGLLVPVSGMVMTSGAVPTQGSPLVLRQAPLMV